MISVRSPRPPAARSRLGERWLSGPSPEQAGFGPRFVIAASFGSVLNPVNTSIVAVALTAIGHTFGAGAAATTWLVSALYLATAIGQPTAGRLADMFPRDDPASTAHGLDVTGLALFAAALTGLLVFLMDLAAPRWWLLAAAAIALAALAARELRARDPFIDVRLLACNHALIVTYLRFGVTMLITYGFIYGWTLWLEQAAGRDATGAGLHRLGLLLTVAAVALLATTLLATTLLATTRAGWPGRSLGACSEP